MYPLTKATSKHIKWSDFYSLNFPRIPDAALSRAKRSTTAVTGDHTHLLSRQRRFLIPDSSGYTFTTTFAFKFPLADVGSTVTVSVPFTYNFDAGT